MDDFKSVCAVERIEHLRYRVEVPEGWQQGRGAFGGLAIGFAVRAMEEVESTRPLRVLTAELPGPLMVGEAQVEVLELRRGSGTTALEAHVRQGDAVCARVSGIFGREREDKRSWMPERPAMGDWRSLPPLDSAAVPPPFARAFEYRLAGFPPFCSAPEARTEGWIGLRGGVCALGPAEIAALADAFWPACFATQTGPRPMATIAYTLHLLEGSGQLTSAEPLFYRARCEVASSGFLFEMRELWTADGKLVAINPQTFVVIK